MSITQVRSPSKSSAGSVGLAPTVPTVVAVSIAALVVVGQLYAVLPLINTLASEFGTSPASAAWASTAFGFAYAVGMLVAGPLSDAVGRRRVAVAGLLAGALGTALVSISPSFAVLLVTRVVQGAAAAFFPPVALAYLTERVAPHRRPAALSTVLGAFLAAAIVAPLAATALSELGGWRTWFYASAAALVILAGVLWRVMLPDTRARGTSAGSVVSSQLAELPKLLGRRTLVGLYLATMSVMITFVGVTTLVQLAGPGTAGHSAVMQGVRAATLPACVLIPLAAPVLARLSGGRRLVAAMIVVALGAIVTGAASGPVALAFSLGVVTLGVAAAAPALVETISQASPPAQRGAATALYGFALFAGASLGAPAAAIVNIPYLAIAIGFAAIAALGSLGAFVATRTSRA